MKSLPNYVLLSFNSDGDLVSNVQYFDGATAQKKYDELCKEIVANNSFVKVTKMFTPNGVTEFSIDKFNREISTKPIDINYYQDHYNGHFYKMETRSSNNQRIIDWYIMSRLDGSSLFVWKRCKEPNDKEIQYINPDSFIDICIG